MSGANNWSAAGPCWSTGNPPADGDDVHLNDTNASPTNYDLNRTFRIVTLNTPTAAAFPGFTIDNAGGTFGI
jgi:hypothetical protein